MKYFTEAQWLKQQYTGRWGDNPYNHSRVAAGELPEAYIGRRTLMVNDDTGTSLLTEGFHFMVDDEEGHTVPWHEPYNYIEVYFTHGMSICIRSKRDSYSLEEVEAFIAGTSATQADALDDIMGEKGEVWYTNDISEQEARENYDFSNFDSWPIF